MIDDGDDVSSEPVVRWPDFKDPLADNDNPSKPNGNKSCECSIKDTHLAILRTTDYNNKLTEELKESKNAHHSHVFENITNSFLIVLVCAFSVATVVSCFNIEYPILDLLFSLRT